MKSSEEETPKIEETSKEEEITKEENQEDYDESSIRKMRLKGKDNKIYTFEIIKEKNEKIIFQAMFEDLKDVVYEKELKHSDFIKANNIYKKFDDIEELYSVFLIKCEESKIILNSEKNKVSLSLFVQFSTKEYETKFFLSPKKASVDSRLNSMSQTIQEQKHEIETLKNEVETNKNEIKNLKCKIQELEKIKEISEKNVKDINKLQTDYEETAQLKEELKEQKENYLKSVEEMKDLIEKQKNEIENMKKKYESNMKGNEELENKIKKNSEDIKCTNERLAKYLNDINTIQSLNKTILDQTNTFIDQQSSLLKSHIDLNTEKIKSYDIQFNNIKEEFNKKIDKDTCNIGIIMDVGSEIIKYDELVIVKEGVLKKLNRCIKEFKLLFKASKDGYEAQSFHSKCDNKSNTVTFVKTNIGRRFGGFTDQKWDTSGSYKTGSNGFLFSLDSKEIYYNKNSSYNIYGTSSYGPYFGNGDFYIGNNCNSGQNSSESSNNSYNANNKTYALTGQSSFTVEDYEVYQVIFE